MYATCLTNHVVKLVMTIVSMLFLISCQENISDSKISTPSHQLQLKRIAYEQFPLIYPVPGTIIPKQRIKIASRFTGYIERIPVEEGDIIKPGDLLALIDESNVVSAVTQAEATLSAAQAELLDAKDDVKRFEKLVRTQILAQDQLRNAKVRLAQSKAALTSARAGLVEKQKDKQYSHITSHVHALVHLRHTDPGNLTSPGMPILSLDVMNEMQFEFFLPAKRISAIELGQEVDIVLDTPATIVKGKISHIVASADPVTRRFKVKIDLPQDIKLMPGQFGRANIILKNEPSIIIPVQSIVERAGIEGVFVVASDGIARFRSVRLGRKQHALREVLAGIDAGMVVVLNPPHELREGDHVQGNI